MNRTYNLIFPTDKGVFNMKVTLVKSFDEKISLRQGYRESSEEDPVPIKLVKVVPKDPELDRITDRKQIKKVLQQSDIISIIEDEDGNYVQIKKETLKGMNPSNASMMVERIVPQEKIPFYYLSGKHYFLNVKTTRKNKKRVADLEDKEIYRCINTGLQKSGLVLIVNYTAFNTSKHAIVYGTEDGLRISEIIANNYQRLRSDVQSLEGKFDSRIFNGLTKKKIRDEIKPKYFKDTHQEKLKELIEATLNGEEIEEEPVENTTFTRLSALFSEEEEDDEPGRPKSEKKSKKKKKEKERRTKSE